METDTKCNGFAKEVTEEENENAVRSLDESTSQVDTSSIPFQPQDDARSYQTNLFSYEDTDPNYHFGLIRGYHRELYAKEPGSEQSFLCCQPLDRDTVSRIKRRNRILSYQVTGILCGAVFVFFGIFSLIVTFFFSSDGTKDYVWRSLDIPTMYIHIIAIIGLTILTLGSALISLCLLVPVLVGRLHGQNVPTFWCTTGDMYIKHAEKMAPNQFLYFDAAHYRNFVGDPDVKKVQPEDKIEKD